MGQTADVVFTPALHVALHRVLEQGITAGQVDRRESQKLSDLQRSPSEHHRTLERVRHRHVRRQLVLGDLEVPLQQLVDEGAL
eukprot:5159007-Heterocapsa_arctica.AAC.1